MASSNSYNRTFYDTQRSGSIQSAKKIVPIFMEYVRPRCVVDIGCGSGTWLSIFKEHGVEEIVGYDGDYVQADQLLIPATCFHPVNLETDVISASKADLALSLEVAEHLSPSAGDRLVMSLTKSSDIVAFSAAVPGQGGTRHINEQWPAYWAERFAAQGFGCFDVLRPRIWNDASIEPWYRQNIFLYVKSGSELFGKLEAAKPPILGDFNVIHPETYNLLNREHSLENYSGRELLSAAFAKLLRRMKVLKRK